MRRVAVVAVAVVMSSLSAFAAEVPPPSLAEIRSLDLTGSELARHAGALASETVARRRAPGFAAAAAAPVPGWTVTQVGNVVFLQDDGTHQCDGQLSNEWFDTCMAGSNAALDAFYAAYPDANPGYASFYLGWDINAFFAFYQPIANNVDGIGSPKHGNAAGLNGLIFMNSVDLYTSYGEENREFLFDMIWGQEFGHRWGAFVSFVDDSGEISDELLGRDSSHWSYFLDSDWSWMEGNDWEQSGNSFTTEFSTFGKPGYGYSQLDMYLMGFLPPSGVDDFFFIRNPSGSGKPEDPPAVMYGQADTVTGKRVNVSIDQIIEAEGERNPTWKNADRSFQVANIVILRSTDSITAALQSDMADYNEWATTHFSRDSFELAYVDTTIGAMAPNVAPTAVLVLPTEAKADGDAVTLSASGSSDPENESLTYVWDFGDGTADYRSGATVEHVFQKHGELTVTVLAIDARGQSNDATGTITVAKADGKGGEGGLGIGCSVSGTPADAIPTASLALLGLAGALGLALRRRAI
jgi:MYXO-CTERM domain-containing protein